MTDQDVRDMLRERASTITPSPDGLERIQAKLDGGVPVVSDRRRRPMPMLAAAAAVVVVALLGAVLVAQRDDGSPVVTTPGPSEELGAVWPSNDPQVLRSISASWGRSDSPILAAQQYLRDRLGVEVDEADISSVPEGDGGVSVATPHSIVTLQRLDGDGPWYVTMSSSPNVAGLDLQHRGDTVDFSALTGVAGELRVEVRAPGSEDASSSTIDAIERETVSTSVDISGTTLTDETVAVAGILTTDTGEVFLSESAVGAPAGPPTTGGVPLGVWPWPGDPVDDSVFADPGDTARAYVASRVLDIGETSEMGRSEEDGGVAIIFGGAVSTTVHLRQDDGRWYVERSDSDLVTLHDAGDGTVTARIETAGVLTRSTVVSGSLDTASEEGEVQGGEEYPGLGYTLGRDDVAVRELFVLDTSDGTVGITETSFRAGTPPMDPDAPVSPDEQLGVWPTLGDDVDAETLSDPVSTAARYLADTVGTTSATVLSDFRSGDSTSGEVEVTGDITATIVLRTVDGRWHVEAVWSPLVEAAELRPGEVSLTSREDGVLTVTVLDSYGSVVQSMPASGVSAGEEKLVVPDAPDGTPLTVRWTLQTPRDAPTTSALGDVRLYGGAMSEQPVETAVPDDAIWDVAALDARELASQYLGDRLGGRTVTTNDASITGGTAEVTWEAGVVLLRKVEDLWFVVEAIGDSVQIEGFSRDVGYISGTVVVAEPGTLRFSAGSTTWEIAVDQAGEGTRVPFEHEIDDASSSSLRVVFATANGFVSLAEQPL